MTQDEARAAAVENAIDRINPGMTIGLGSGRAVFALTSLIGERKLARIKAVVASPATQDLAEAAGIEVVDLDGNTTLDIAFDGADEIDADFAMVKGGGAALLIEKLVMAAARHVVIMVEDVKLVKHLGDTRLLPVEVVRFGWEATRARILKLVPDAQLRMVADAPVITSQNHYLIDITVPHRPLPEFAAELKLMLGVVDHGLFLDQANEVIMGRADGSIEILTRPPR